MWCGDRFLWPKGQNGVPIFESGSRGELMRTGPFKLDIGTCLEHHYTRKSGEEGELKPLWLLRCYYNLSLIQKTANIQTSTPSAKAQFFTDGSFVKNNKGQTYFSSFLQAELLDITLCCSRGSLRMLRWALASQESLLIETV